MAKLVFFVRSAEDHNCPICEKELNVIGSRERKGRKPTGERVTYRIRRLRCTGCNRIHHELPDLLVPYKRYESDCVESILEGEQIADVAADDSTLYRWRQWFAQLWPQWVGGLSSIDHRLGIKVKSSSMSLPSALQEIGRFVGQQKGWLARLVRPLVNAQYWIHTRFAFLSVDP